MMNKKAVSPVIGVILMVAITVILAAVIYIWVTGFALGKSPPSMGVTCRKHGDTFVVKVESIGRAVSAAAVKVVVTRDGTTLCEATADELMGTGNESFHDDGDGIVGGGDVFHFKDENYDIGDKVAFVHTPSKSIMTTITLRT